MLNHEWSEALKTQTRETIADGRLGWFPTRDGQLYMKHAKGRFGTIAIDDLRDDILRLVELRRGEADKGEAIVFATVDDLIDAGWVID
jgi:hypothetical protein